MIELKLTFATFEEAAEAMLKLSGSLLQMDGGAPVAVTTAEPAEATVEAPKRRGRPPKAASENPTAPAPQNTAAPAGGEAASSSGAAPTEEPNIRATPEDRQDPENPEPEQPTEAAAEAKTYTKDDAKVALSKVLRKVGQDECRAFLKDYGYDRLGDVPEDKYADFIAKCEAKAA